MRASLSLPTRLTALVRICLHARAEIAAVREKGDSQQLNQDPSPLVLAAAPDKFHNYDGVYRVNSRLLTIISCFYYNLLTKNVEALGEKGKEKNRPPPAGCEYYPAI